MPRLAVAGMALVVAALVVAAGWQRRRIVTAGAAMPGFYAHALRVLARRGLTPGVGETAREFARRVSAAPWAAPLAPLTVAYERVRFGGAGLTPAERADVEAALRDLIAAARARRPSSTRATGPDAMT